MNDDLTTIEVTVSRIITADGQLAVRVKTPENYSSVEVLGLLETAKLHVYNEMRHDG
jgi:hypothetical protein